MTYDPANDPANVRRALDEARADAQSWKEQAEQRTADALELVKVAEAEVARLREALAGLLIGWKNFQSAHNGGNQEEAYYCLAKYLRPQWEAAEAALLTTSANEE